ncbi:MAG: trimethylamine methyltransferase family protein, partial [Rhodospirillales bacterium]|nr:trimethylamine methyltransferase family protein [Rhodospirillales bacterium]
MSRRGTERGGAEGRRAKRDIGRLKQLPFRQVTNPYPPMEIVSAEQIEAIHRASLDALQEIGMNFLLPEAREILKAAGAEVAADGPRVRFDRHLIEEKIKTAPAMFRMHARNPDHDLTFGGNHMNFCSVGSPPNASDIEGGRRPGNFADYCDLLRLTQSLNIAHLSGGYPVEPTDIEPDIRHLRAVGTLLKLTDKV